MVSGACGAGEEYLGAVWGVGENIGNLRFVICNLARRPRGSIINYKLEITNERGPHSPSKDLLHCQR